MCSQLATRVYLPRADSLPGCRRCWGLSYDSRKADYQARGPFYLSLLGEAATILARERRLEASEARYAERRSILANKRGGRQHLK